MLLKILAETDKIIDYFTDIQQKAIQHSDDIGLDLITNETVIIQPFECKLVSLGIKTAMYDENNVNVGWELWPRSSISKTPLQLANSIGLIDPGYRGTVKAPFRNLSMTPYIVDEGSRLVQAVAFDRTNIKIELVDKLDETIRGDGGFGSTGK